MAASTASVAKDVTISDVASVIQSGFFLVTGSASADGYPIIFSLDGVNPEPADEKQKNALVYIASLPTFSTDKNLHYCFVLDRRKSSWTCVRKMFTLISTSFTRPVKEVFLLQPTGFFQRRFSVSESVKLQNEFPAFQTVVLDDTDALIQKFGVESVCEQLGGSINGTMDSFIQQRMSVDSLEANCVDLEDRVKELLLHDAQSDFDIPNDVASIEALLNEHAEVKTNLSDEISNIKSQGEVVLKCFRSNVENLPHSQQILHIQEVQKLTTRLDDLDEAIRDYWEKEETKLQEFMKLREFHDEFKVLHHNLNRLSEVLTNVKDYVSSVEEAISNSKRLTKFETDSQSLLSRSKWLAKVWSSKLSSTDDMTSHTIAPKCEELTRLYDVCTESLKYKQMLASKQTTLHEHLDQARQWLSDELSHPSNAEACSESTLSEQVKQIDCQIAIGKFLELLNFEDFMKTYSTFLSEESEAVVRETYQQVMELMARYEMGRYSLYERLSRLIAPLKPSKKDKQSKARAPSLPSLPFGRVTGAEEREKNFPDIIEKSGLLKPDTNSPSGKRKDRRSSSKRGDSQGSVTSDTSSVMSSHTLDDSTSPRQSLSTGPASPTGSSLSQTTGTNKADEDRQSESSELLSECSDQFNIAGKGTSNSSAESNQTSEIPVSKWRRGSIKALKAKFSRKKSRQDLFDDQSEQSLNVNTGVFEKSLTLEEENSMARVRRQLIADLVSSEAKYVEDLKHMIEFYMRPIAEAGDSVSTELYANQSLIFSNLEELYDLSSKTFLHELTDSADSPSLIASAFRNRVKDLTKYRDYCTSRSRAEVILRQLAGDAFLAERLRMQGNNNTLCSQLLLPAKQVVNYNTFLQAMYNNLKDDLEAQRDIQLVISLLSDTTQTAANLLHQVTIDGYHEFIDYLEEVDLATHGSLLHQGRVLVAHDKKSNHTKPSDFKTKLKPRHIFLFENCLLFCKIHEENNKLRPYSFMHSMKLSDSALQKAAETSTKFVFRSNNESYLIQCEVSEQSSWYENIQFALNNCDNKHEELSPRRGYNSHSTSLSSNSFNHKPAKLQSSIHDDHNNMILGEDPDVDMFNLDTDIDLIDGMTRRHNSGGYSEINGNTFKQYMLKEDFDNDLLLGRGDVVECVTIRRDMMQVQIPGTAIKSWMPTDVLVSYD